MSTGVSTAPSLLKLLKKAFSIFWLAPVHFILLQIPEASVEVISEFLLPQGGLRIPLAIILLFPYFCVASVLSAALTFVSVRRREAGETISVRVAIREVLPKFSVLVPVSLLNGIILILGLLTVFVALFYYMAIYLFVPYLLVTEPHLPWSVYLYRSKKIAKRSLGKCCVLVFAMLVLSFSSDALVGIVGMAFSRTPTLGVQSFLFGVKILFSLITSALTAMWISYYFLELRAINKE